jgi:hypothetical protein
MKMNLPPVASLHVDVCCEQRVSRGSIDTRDRGQHKLVVHSPSRGDTVILTENDINDSKITV